MIKCERCSKNLANVHILKVFDGIKKELNICEKCAKELGEFNINPINDIENSFSLNILSGLVDYFNQSHNSSVSKESDMKCSNCGTTYAEFKQTGFLGCKECYEKFSKILNVFINYSFSIPYVKHWCIHCGYRFESSTPEYDNKSAYNKNNSFSYDNKTMYTNTSNIAKTKGDVSYYLSRLIELYEQN